MIFITLASLLALLALYTVLRRTRARITALEADIAELEQSAELAGNIRRQQQAILDNIPDMFWLKDAESRYLMVNKACCEASGLSADRMIGKTSREIWPRDLAEQYCSNDAWVMASGVQKCNEEYMEFSTGERKWIETIKTPVFDDTGKVMGTTGIARDIHARKKAEQALRESEERLAAIFEASQSGILQVDTEGRIVFANQRMADMLAYPLDELTGSFYTDHIHESERSAGNESMLRLAAGTVDSVCTERRYRRKDGTDFLGYISSRRLENSDRTLKGLVGNITDITERKQMQELMAQAEKMATISGLAAGMAHELNTPLGAILQHVQNIQRRLSANLPANAAVARELGLDFDLMRHYLDRRGIEEMLGYVTEAGARAADIIANLLDFNNAGGVTLEETSLPGLIDGVMDLAAHDFDLKKNHDFSAITINRDFDPSLPPIIMNRREMERALLNIVKNATQALAEQASDAAPRISLRTRRDGRHARIDITDNGPGMPEEISRRIFEPFFTTRQLDGGSGLGLSAAYTLVVDNHNGRIGVDSAPGRGTTFTIHLPLEEPHRDGSYTS